MLKRKCKITFICHGSTIYTEENRLYDKDNYPSLNKNGKEEIKKLAKWLEIRAPKNDKIYTAPTQSSIQTARIISEIYDDMPYEIIDELKPCNRGDWAGLTFEQITKDYKEQLMLYHENKAGFKIGNGESLNEYNRKIKRVLSDIIELNKGKRIIIVTCQDAISSAIAKALDIPTKNQNNIIIQTGSASQINYYKDWAHLIYSNYVPI